MPVSFAALFVGLLVFLEDSQLTTDIASSKMRKYLVIIIVVFSGLGENIVFPRLVGYYFKSKVVRYKSNTYPNVLASQLI